ncbi:MAG TPA: hypothetical protein DDY13_00960 [Cytophagales bacterium]|jgi:hypothetical protein|nr:hypothetical protein [Cytophagales bacterium]
MEEISELIQIVNNYTKKNLPLIDLRAQSDNENKELKLFLGIKNGEFLTDEDGSNGIYGTKEVDFKFRMLKSRLNRKLLNHLFFVDLGNGHLHKSQSLEQECLDYMYFAKMLIKLGELKVAIKLLYKAVEQAKELELTDTVLEGLKEMRNIYSITYRPKLFNNIQEQIEKYKLKSIEEEKAYAIYYEQKLSLNSTINNRKKDLKPLQEAIVELADMYEATNSYNIFIRYLKLRIWFLELDGEYEALIKLADKVMADFKADKFKKLKFDPEILVKSKANAYLKLPDHRKGENMLVKYLNKLSEGSNSWFDFMELLVRMVIKRNDIEYAHRLMLDVVNQKQFHQQNEERIQEWNLYQAYLYFLNGNKKLIKKFDYQAFIEQIPEYSKEHASHNVARLMLQVIVKIDGPLEDLEACLEAIDDYTIKYLNNSFSKRAKIFSKLLTKIAAHDREYDMIAMKSKYLEEKLEETGPQGDYYADLELIPYDIMWKMAMKKIARNRYQKVY